MRKFLVVAVAVAALGVAAPASAQVFIGADHGGAGVQVGPLGVGVGPRFSDDGYRHRRGYDSNAYYAGECRMVRTRTSAQRPLGIPHAARLPLSQAPIHTEMAPRKRGSSLRSKNPGR